MKVRFFRRGYRSGWELNIIGRVWNLRIAQHQVALWKHQRAVLNFLNAPEPAIQIGVPALAVLAMAALVSCSPAAPTPVAVAPAPACSVNVTVSGDGATTVNGCGNTVTVVPSPSPSGPFQKPDYVKITQFGESCSPGTEPSGVDRSVKIGCTKALTLSPKCHQASGPDIDCPVPDNAKPDEFKCISGCEHINFAAFGGGSLDVSLFSGAHMQTDAFNRLATGKTEGAAVITGSYAGIRAQDDFILTVVK